jgi:hypothetical protein
MWNSWEDYLNEWIDRPNFRAALPVMLVKIPTLSPIWRGQRDDLNREPLPPYFGSLYPAISNPAWLIF